MFVYLSYIFQLFDVKCFKLLKILYSKKIQKMMCMQITYIIKNDFFPAFKHVFFVNMDLKNAQLNSKTINLVPYNPEKIIGGLDFKFCTFKFSNFYLMNFTFINPNISYTMKNVVQNFVNLEFRNVMPWSNLFNYLYELTDM